METKNDKQQTKNLNEVSNTILQSLPAEKVKEITLAAIKEIAGGER